MMNNYNSSIGASPVSYETINNIPSMYINDEHRVVFRTVILGQR